MRPQTEIETGLLALAHNLAKRCAETPILVIFCQKNLNTKYIRQHFIGVMLWSENIN